MRATHTHTHTHTETETAHPGSTHEEQTIPDAAAAFMLTQLKYDKKATMAEMIPTLKN